MKIGQIVQELKHTQTRGQYRDHVDLLHFSMLKEISLSFLTHEAETEFIVCKKYGKAKFSMCLTKYHAMKTY
jgi:hypothetical protein